MIVPASLRPMPHINSSSREIIAKIVYCGPGVGGKTTNVEQIGQHVDARQRGRILSLATAAERTLLFDLLALESEPIGGYKLRFQIMTVPGQLYYRAARRRVLNGADALVYVADSMPERYEANVEGMQDLVDAMGEFEMTFDKTPLVIQYNKRDVPQALPISVLEDALNPEAVPAFEAIAIRCVGVFEVLAEAMRLVDARLRADLLRR